MANAKRDENFVTTLLATSNADGKSIILVEGNPTTHTLSVQDGTDGVDRGGTYAKRDENSVPVLLCESSAGNGALVAVYANTSGQLLIDSS